MEYAAAHADLAAWWSAAGRPGAAPDAWLVSAWPATFAGLVLDGVAFDERGRAPHHVIGPGVAPARLPAAVFDSIAVHAGARTPRVVTGEVRPRATSRARSVVSLANGSFGYEENALTVERGDSLRWARADVASGLRGDGGGWQTSRRHVWGAALGTAFGAHRLEGSFAQRGASARLTGGEATSASGESGAFGWRRTSDRLTLWLNAERAWDGQAGYDAFRVWSRRDAAANRLVAGARADRSAGAWSARAEWTDASVVRTFDRAFHASEQGLWFEGGWERPFADGTLTIGGGLGRPAGAADLEWAPSIGYRTREGGVIARVEVARRITPVWADLAAGETPFVQRVWHGSVGVDASVPGGSAYEGSRAAVTFHALHAENRALAERGPIAELWLRRGFRAADGRDAVGLLEASAEAARGPVAVRVRGFASTRDRAPEERLIEAAHGFHAEGEGRARLFAGDLDVRIALTADGYGPRESQAAFARRLPGYVTYGARLAVRLADANVVVRFRNLEDRRREHVWIDGATGMEALGPGRELRFALSWRLAG